MYKLYCHRYLGTLYGQAHIEEAIRDGAKLEIVHLETFLPPRDKKTDIDMEGPAGLWQTWVIQQTCWADLEFCGAASVRREGGKEGRGN